jgi:transcriptional regulator with XRE-family HTH domain
MSKSDTLPQAVINLRKIWQQKKIEMQFTQVEAAKDMDWTQSAISHYLNHITELNPAAIVKFANFLDVDPLEIDPEVEHNLPFVSRLPLAYNSDDMTRPINDHVYSRKTDVTIYVKLSNTAQVEGCKEINREPVTTAGLTGVAQICAVDKYPSAKILAVRLKEEKKLRFYLKDDVPPTSDIQKLWAVVAFIYI